MTKVLFKVSLLTDDYKLNDIAIKTLNLTTSEIEQYPVAVPTAYSNYLSYKHRYKVLKSSKKNLLANKTIISHITDPFVLTKAVDFDNDIYQGCVIDSCFATADNITDIIKKIDEYK